MADQPLGTSGQMVLLEKGTPQIVIDPAQNPRGDSRQNPVDCRAFNSVLVDVIAAAPNTVATTVTVIGSPVGSEPWIQEWDPNAIQTIAAGTNKRFLVTAVSAWVAVDLTQAAGWRIVITPLDSPAQTTINFTSGANMNLAEVGGAAIGPANPVPTAPQGTANMNLGQVGGANLTLGQKTSATSVPVVIASDQSVIPTQVQGALTDRSGAITTGGTQQQLAPANAGRRYLVIENPSTAAAQGIATAESLWINFTAAAVVGTPSVELLPGGSLVMESSFVSVELVSVIATTTGHRWMAKEA